MKKSEKGLKFYIVVFLIITIVGSVFWILIYNSMNENTSEEKNDIAVKTTGDFDNFNVSVPKDVEKEIDDENRASYIDQQIEDKKRDSLKKLRERESFSQFEKQPVSIDMNKMIDATNTNVKPAKKAATEEESLPKPKKNSTAKTKKARDKVVSEPREIERENDDYHRRKRGFVIIEDDATEESVTEKKLKKSDLNDEFLAIINETKEATSTGGFSVSIRCVEDDKVSVCDVSRGKTFFASVLGNIGSRIDVVVKVNCNGKKRKFYAYDFDDERGIYFDEITEANKTKGRGISNAASAVVQAVTARVNIPGLSAVSSAAGSTAEDLFNASVNKVSFTLEKNKRIVFKIEPEKEEY